jgi:hypothetical protein
MNIPRYPPKLDAIITIKNQNFVGRGFVFASINEFLQQQDRGYFTIIGEPGIGKSAIAAHYVRQNSSIAYYSLEAFPSQSLSKCRQNLYENFLATISNQLIEIAQNQGNNNAGDNFSDLSSENSDLSILLQKISDRLPNDQRLIIVIDGCDRIDLNQYSRGENLLCLPRYLPKKVYFILTRRPFLSEKSCLLIESPSQILDLADYPEQNQLDIQEYINNYLNSHPIKEELATKIRQNETNFMYVSEILKASHQGKNDLSKNLQKFYQQHWEKINLVIDKWKPTGLQILNILLQQKQSISIETISERLDKDEYEIHLILNQWREFLHLEKIAGQIHYQFYHFSFCDWLRQKLNIQQP